MLYAAAAVESMRCCMLCAAAAVQSMQVNEQVGFSAYLSRKMLTMLWRTLTFVPFTGGVQVTAMLEDGREFEGDLFLKIGANLN